MERIAGAVWLCRCNNFWANLISELLLNQFWANFKGRFIGPSLTDSNCNDDICTSNICHGDQIKLNKTYFNWIELNKRKTNLKSRCLTSTRVCEQLTKTGGSIHTSQLFHFLFVQMPQFIEKEGRRLLESMISNEIPA